MGARYQVKAFEEEQHPRDGDGRFARKPASAVPKVGDLIWPGDGDEDDAPPHEQARIAAGLRRAIDGTYAGMDAAVSRVQVEALSTVVDVNVRHDGRTVGAAVREFYTTADDDLVVGHDLLELDPEAQGKGFASAFNRHMEQWYRESGVTMITTHAAMTTGGYAWAAADWDWNTSDTEQRSGAADVLARLRDRLGDLDNEIVELEDILAALPDDYHNRPSLQGRLDAMRRHSADATRLLDRADRHDFGEPGYPTPFEISQLGREPGQADSLDPDRWWLGKKTMMGADWRGVKYLADTGDEGGRKAGGPVSRRAMMAELAAWHHQWELDRAVAEPGFNGDDPGAHSAYVTAVTEILARGRGEDVS